MSGNDTRDQKMKKEVLETQRFADVSFAPHSYQGSIPASGDATIQVTGTFTLHGTPHELTIPIQVHIEGANCTAKTHFSVPFVKWGLKDPSTFVLRVSKEVEIELTLVGHLSPTT
jgi:polyisoprenoid-binding protein YceI